MSLFCRGIVPDETITEMMELRCYLDLVAGKNLNDLIGFWSYQTGKPFGAQEARMLRYNANQLVTELHIAISAAESVRDSIENRVQKAEGGWAR